MLNGVSATLRKRLPQIEFLEFTCSGIHSWAPTKLSLGLGQEAIAAASVAVYRALDGSCCTVERRDCA
jgi:hypothetical protein